MGLGFQPEVTASQSKVNIKHINLGPNMFDRPNKDALFIVTHFLLEKLNPTRFQESYRHCWPVLDHKADAEFRKVTCAWIQDIMAKGRNGLQPGYRKDKNGRAGHKVMASLFLSPGGPKFTNLMLCLANHVMLQDMKTFSTDGTWVPEAAGSPASCMITAGKRLQLVKTKFIRGAVDQDRLLQEYQKQAQCQVKSLRDRRAEDSKYEDLLKHHNKDTEQDRSSLAQKIQKVRSLWSTIEGVLSALEKERRVVESVVRGEVDQYALDGNDLHLQIPPALLQRIEQRHHQESVGGVYEAGQMNLLRTLELFNHALRLLGDERSQATGINPAPRLDAQALQEKSQQMVRSLEDLRLMRIKIIKEEIPEVKSVIRMLEEDWDRRWAETLKFRPLPTFLNEDPALNFMSPMAPLCFEPATEASLRSSVFSQYPAKLLEMHPESSEEEPTEKDSEPLCTVTTVTADVDRDYLPAVERAGHRVSSGSVFSTLTNPLCAPAETPRADPVSAPSTAPQKASVSKSSIPRPKHSVVKKKAQILDWECDNLADQFSEAVTTSPAGGCVGVELGSLLSTLAADPFSTRKQLPRTPESLIWDVKNSWRRAVEEGEARKASQSTKLENDSVMKPLSPVVPPPDTPSDPPSAHQQRASLMSTLSWDYSNMDIFHSTGLLQFSLANETLSEFPCGDSLFSISDGLPGSPTTKEEEEEELLLPHVPSLTTGVQPALLAARERLDRIHQACAEASFMDAIKGVPSEPSPLLFDRQDSNTSDWLMGTTGETATTEPIEKVFSLELETLDSPSPPSSVRYSLPKLVTFSPIDDL